ncbi:MAG: hypothetical protein KGH75_02750 [Rhodospirillales bacterium]|nr:hypothetical protein [Rhodospirillales bacterium]
MAASLADRVKDSTNTAINGALVAVTLSGTTAPPFQTFAAGYGTGTVAQIPVVYVGANNAWMCAWSTLTASTTLTPNTVTSSSAGGTTVPTLTAPITVTASLTASAVPAVSFTQITAAQLAAFKAAPATATAGTIYQADAASNPPYSLWVYDGATFKEVPALATDSTGNIIANIVPRVDTYANLTGVDILGAGELASASDAPAVVMGTGGVAGGAVITSLPGVTATINTGAAATYTLSANQLAEVVSLTGTVSCSVTLPSLPATMIGATTTIRGNVHSLAVNANLAANVPTGNSSAMTPTNGPVSGVYTPGLMLQWSGTQWTLAASIGSLTAPGIYNAIALQGKASGFGSASIGVGPTIGYRVYTGMPQVVQSNAVGDGSLALQGGVAYSLGSLAIGGAALALGDFSMAIGVGYISAPPYILGQTASPSYAYDGSFSIAGAYALGHQSFGMSPYAICGGGAGGTTPTAVASTGVVTGDATPTAALSHLTVPIGAAATAAAWQVGDFAIVSLGSSGGAAVSGAVSAVAVGASVTIQLNTQGGFSTSPVPLHAAILAAAVGQVTIANTTPGSFSMMLGNGQVFRRGATSFNAMSSNQSANKASTLDHFGFNVTATTATEVTVDGVVPSATQTNIGGSNRFITETGKVYSTIAQIVCKQGTSRFYALRNVRFCNNAGVVTIDATQVVGVDTSVGFATAPTVAFAGSGTAMQCLITAPTATAGAPVVTSVQFLNTEALA